MTGNPTLDKVILGINGLMMTGAAALVFFSHNMLKKPMTNQPVEFGTMIEGSMEQYNSQPVTMDEIVVNLYSREARLRFLNTQMNLVLYSESDRELAQIMKPHIFDTLVEVAGNMQPKEVNSITGRILLESRIINKVNGIAKKPLIKKILFSKFIVQ